MADKDFKHFKYFTVDKLGVQAVVSVFKFDLDKYGQAFNLEDKVFLQLFLMQFFQSLLRKCWGIRMLSETFLKF